jgi:hemerythrin-like domain-containing protein
MDAITLLKDDHKSLEQLFKRFEDAGDRAFVEKRKIVDRIIEELSVHAAIEEQFFYPVARATVPDTDELALEAIEEHGIVKWLLHDLEKMSVENERFDAKVTVLIETVRHHLEEEEQELFPKVRDELGRNALADLGEVLEDARKLAPTHPHPRAGDTPPANLAMGPAAGVMDRLGDTVSGVAQGTVTALGDIIATVLRRKKPRVSPTGSSTARKTAAKVRAEASDATQAVIDLTQETIERTKDAADAASSGAKATATSARKGAKQTKSTAKRATTSTGRAASS